MPTLAETLTKYIRTVNDISDHLLTMQQLAMDCDHVTEVGVREGCSIWAWLSGRPKVLRGYDRNPLPLESLLELNRQAKDLGVDFRFQQANILTVEIEETDLLFIDTLHTYKQLSMELHLHADKVRKYLVLHDTVTFGHMDGAVVGEGDPPPALEAFCATLGDKLGLRPAIEEFLTANPHWALEAHYPSNHGLTVLRRRGR